MRDVRIGIVGCGHAALVHLGRLAAIEGVRVVGCVDPVAGAASALAHEASRLAGGGPVPTFADHLELLRAAGPDALAIFTPHLAHYRPALDAIQAGCHVFVEKPLSTNVQEAADIVNIARARGRKVAVGHHYRLLPALIEARRRLAAGAIGPVCLVTATLARPRRPSIGAGERPAPGPVDLLADVGAHLIDALLWSLGTSAVEVAAIRGGPDGSTAASARLADGTFATLGLSEDAAVPLFELTFVGGLGWLRITEDCLTAGGPGPSGGEGEVSPLPAPIESIDGNFVAAIRDEVPLCCPAEEALDAVRLIEAIARSGATGQVVRLG